MNTTENNEQASQSDQSNRNAVFDYRALRLLMGIIALTLPFVVSAIATGKLSSISASYHTDARNAFVGQLFIVASFLWAYNGHARRESVFSKIASVAALLVATCPTDCDVCNSVCKVCEGHWTVYVHYISAVTLFLILTYFCLGPFRDKKRGLGPMRKRRRRIYLGCALIMVACMLAAAIAKLLLSNQQLIQYRVLFWAESIALCAFGVAWIVAGKCVKYLVDSKERLVLFKKAKT